MCCWTSNKEKKKKRKKQVRGLEPLNLYGQFVVLIAKFEQENSPNLHMPSTVWICILEKWLSAKILIIPHQFCTFHRHSNMLELVCSTMAQASFLKKRWTYMMCRCYALFLVGVKPRVSFILLRIKLHKVGSTHTRCQIEAYREEAPKCNVLTWGRRKPIGLSDQIVLSSLLWHLSRP